MKHTKKGTKSRRAFMTIDAVAALIILSILAIVLSVTFVRRSRAAAHLSDIRDAARLADRTLLTLRQDPSAKSDPHDAVITPLGKVERSDQLQWTSVRATVNGRSVSILGATRRQP